MSQMMHLFQDILFCISSYSIARGEGASQLRAEKVQLCFFELLCEVCRCVAPRPHSALLWRTLSFFCFFSFFFLLSFFLSRSIWLLIKVHSGCHWEGDLIHHTQKGAHTANLSPCKRKHTHTHTHHTSGFRVHQATSTGYSLSCVLSSLLSLFIFLTACLCRCLSLFALSLFL